MITQERPRTSPRREPLDVERFREELDHVLAAIVPHGQEAWFFKVTAPATEIEALREPFKDFLASVDFQDDSKPQWKTPADWTEGPGDAMAAATFLIPRDAASGQGTDLKMTVTRLPMSGEQTQYVTENVNRWLGQLQQTPLDQTTVQSLTQRLPTKDGKAIVVELAGTMRNRPGRMHPPMNAAQSPATADAPASEAQPAEPKEFAYQPPADWQPGRMNSMRKAAFNVAGDDEQTAEVTVTVFPATAGMSDTLGNVQRWAGIINLDRTDEEIKESLESRKISGLEGTYIELIGDQQPDAILAMIVPRDSQIWFFRMKGSRELVKAQREEFSEFLDSVEFRQ